MTPPKNDKLMNERERGLLRLLANAMNDLGKLRDSIAASRDAQGDDEGWRTDIENAPKDGSTIIIPGGIAYYRENKTYPHYSGWHSITGIEMPGRPLQYELKKWMPFPVLPAPPVIGER